MPPPSSCLFRSVVASLALPLVASCHGSPPSPPEPRSDATTAAPPTSTPATQPAAPAAVPSPPAAPAGWRGAGQVKLDGIGLGDKYGSKVMARSPYEAPCDNDPIDKKARRFMVYGALPCRGRAFPEQTTVMFYLHFAEGEQALEQPIEAIAWLGGTWFSSRSNFPVRVGEPLARASEAFGAAEASFSLARKSEGLLVQRHAGHVYAIAERDRLVGFVIGPMPDDPESEQWRGLMQMWARYTKPPKAPAAGP